MAFQRVYFVRGLPGKTVTRKQYLNTTYSVPLRAKRES